jgi:hypothetical protein
MIHPSPDSGRREYASTAKPLSPCTRSLAPALLALFLLFTARPALPAEIKDCGQLLKERCSTCHYLTRVCQRLEKEQQKGFFGGVLSGSWARTIRNMVNQGAKLTAAEQEKLTRCLDEAVPEVLDVCGLKK